MAEIALREVRDEDLDGIFEQMRDPEGVWMAAFTAEDPDDRAHFEAHMARVRAAPGVTLRAKVQRQGALAEDDEPGWAQNLVETVASGMAGPGPRLAM